MLGIDILDIAVDAGNLSEFDDTATGTAAVAVTEAAAQAGTAYGLAIDTDAGVTVRFRKTFACAWETDDLRMRCHLDPNGVVLATTTERRVFTLLDGANVNYGGIQLRDAGGGSHEVRALARNDGGTSATGWHAISDGPHWIEVRITRASSAVASDGTLTLWVDGAEQEEVTGLDIFDIARPDRAGLEWTSPHASDTGTLYVDELIVRNEDVEIGQVELSHVLARARVEDGTSAEFDSFTASADFNITTAAALAGSRRGIAVTTDNGASLVAAMALSRAWTSRTIRYRHHFDPNGVTLADTSARRIADLVVAGVDNSVETRLYSDGGGGYQIAARALTDDAGDTETAKYAITDAEHNIEVVLRRATSAVAADGELELWIDGTLKEAVTGLDIWDLARPNTARLIWLDGSSSDAGDVYLDELEVRDTDATIGSAVRAERGIVAITIGGNSIDYIPGTGEYSTQIGADPATFRFMTRDTAPDTGDVVVTRTWKDEAGNVNRVETMFTGTVLEVQPAEIGNSGVYESTVLCADDRAEAMDTFITAKIPEQAAETTLATLHAQLPAGWTLNAEAGSNVGPMNLQDSPFPQAAADVARDAGQLFWTAPGKVIHAVAPDSVDGSHEINRPAPEGWGRLDYRRSVGKVANRIIVRGDEGTSVTINDDASQDRYGVRPMIFSAHSVKKVAVLNTIGNTLASAHRLPIVEGSIPARFDRIGVGDNIRISDLKLKLRGFPVRITQITEHQLESHEWEQTISFTSERLLPKLVPPNPAVDLPAIRARGPDLMPAAPIPSEPPRIVHRGPVEGPDDAVAPLAGEYIAQLRIDQGAGVVRLVLDSTHAAAVDQGFKLELISRNVLTVSTGTTGTGGGEDVEVWNNGSNQVTVISSVGGSEGRWSLNNQSKRVDITVSGAYKGARVIVTLFDGDVGSGLDDVLDAFFYGSEEMMSKESIRRDVIFEARLQPQVAKGQLDGAVRDAIQEGELTQAYKLERDEAAGYLDKLRDGRFAGDVRSRDGVSQLIDPDNASVGAALVREPGGPSMRRVFAKSDEADPDDLDGVPDGSSRGSVLNTELDANRVKQLRRAVGAVTVDADDIFDRTREDTTDITEAGQVEFVNGTYTDGNRRPTTLRRALGAVDVDADDAFDTTREDLDDVTNGATYARPRGAHMNDGRVFQIRRVGAGLNVDADDVFDTTREDTTDITEAGSVEFINGTYTDVSRRPIAMRRASEDLDADDVSRLDEVEGNLGGLSEQDIYDAVLVTEVVDRQNEELQNLQMLNNNLVGNPDGSEEPPNVVRAGGVRGLEALDTSFNLNAYITEGTTAARDGANTWGVVWSGDGSQLTSDSGTGESGTGSGDSGGGDITP